MFRRSKSETTSPPTEAPPRAQGKGRPTPKRREAEAAARARAKAAANPKGAGRKDTTRQQRQARTDSSKEIRQGIKDGDERYLPKRDQGPVKRFVRDFVDARLCMAEFAIPLLFASLLASAAGAPQVGTGIMNGTLLVVVLDSVLLRWKLRRELRRRFGAEGLKGTTLYAYMRSLQLRFLRLPKPQVRLGQPLPEHYR